MGRRLVHVRLQLDQRTLDRAIRNSGASRILLDLYHVVIGVPNEWISAHLFATLRDTVKRGAYSDRDDAKKRLSGIFDDIAHVSMYASYCDAFVMDTPMAELVRQPTVALEQRYGVKVFSLRKWDALFTWLDELETGMTREHKAALAAVYP